MKIHIQENREGLKRFGVEWTPTVIIADPSGAERYRFEGYLPFKEFLPLLGVRAGARPHSRGATGRKPSSGFGALRNTIPNLTLRPKRCIGPVWRNTRRPEMPVS